MILLILKSVLTKFKEYLFFPIVKFLKMTFPRNKSSVVELVERSFEIVLSSVFFFFLIFIHRAKDGPPLFYESLLLLNLIKHFSV